MNSDTLLIRSWIDGSPVKPLPLACLVCSMLAALASACAHETRGRPAAASDASNTATVTATPSGPAAAPLPFPESAFHTDDARESEHASRFDTRRIGARTDDGRARSRFHGAPVDIDLKAADVANVFRLLADVGHVNIVVAGEVTGTVTLKLTHIPWDQALDIVARLRGLDVEQDGNVIVVRPAGPQPDARDQAPPQPEFAAARAISDP
jgi:hypothetical protein